MTTQETQKLEILSIETKPEHDPYVNIDGIVSRTYLKLDPRDNTIWVTQEYKDNATPAEEWHGLILTWIVPGHPTEDAMRQWIEENMELFQTICNGYEVVWNGNNHTGSLTLEAHAAADAIEYMLDNDQGPLNYYEYWTVESWLESVRDDITADMSDEQLADLAEQWDATEPQMVIGGTDSILEFITQIRDALRWEQENE